MEQLWSRHKGQKSRNQGPFLADLMVDLAALLGTILA